MKSNWVPGKGEHRAHARFQRDVRPSNIRVGATLVVALPSRLVFHNTHKRCSL
jgi:hypothetical protein